MKTLILAGGSDRLFPLSRGHFPKQFLPIFDGNSLYQNTLRRALMFSSPDEIFVVTNPDQEFIARDQAATVGCSEHILSEPEGKNTLPAVFFGLREIERSFGPAKVAVLPSDQLVHAGPVYADAFRKAESLADEWLVLFGVKGAEPHTGYGYIWPGKGDRRGFFSRLLHRETGSIDRRTVPAGWLPLEQRDVPLLPALFR